MAKPKPIQANPLQRPSAATKPIPPPPPLHPPMSRNDPASPGTQGFSPNIDYSLEPGENAITNARKDAGQTAPSEPGAEIDWAKVYFGQYNLPSDLIGQIETLGKQYGTTNPDVFYNSALNAVRGSDWFKTTYPGFAAGVRAGLFGDENGYRGYVNALNGVYQQYLGRAVSGDETAAALAQGATHTLIANQFQGDALAKTNAPQWSYVTGAFDENGPLTAAEQTALGREQAGIDSPLGQMAQKRVQQASARAASLFGGRLATPSLSLVNGRLAAPSLGGGGTPDIAA